MNRKKRRHSGRVAPLPTVKAKKEVLINECLEPQEFYDDWEDYRDGFRGDNDKTKLQSENAYFAENFEVKRWNKKIKRQIKIRKARKLMPNR